MTGTAEESVVEVEVEAEMDVVEEVIVREQIV